MYYNYYTEKNNVRKIKVECMRREGKKEKNEKMEIEVLKCRL